MQITVTLYGRYKKIADSDIIQLTIPDQATVWHILESFSQLYPEIIKDKPRIMVTKNQQFASPDTPVSSEDNIGLAPPLVAGGYLSGRGRDN